MKNEAISKIMADLAHAHMHEFKFGLYALDNFIGYCKEN